jgi:colicin import membrane protein
MQMLRCYSVFCVAAFALAALSARADNTSTQAPPAGATSSQTVTNQAEVKKQAQAEAKAKKEAEKKAKADAEAKKKAETNARKEAEAKAKAEKGKASQFSTNAVVEKKSGMAQALERPPLPISAGKQQSLQELFKKYKADEITAEQYQKERAKILAGP